MAIMCFQQYYLQVLLTLILTFVGIAVFGQCNNVDEYRSLRGIYLETGGDHWKERSGWPDSLDFVENEDPPFGTDMSKWFGVSCANNRIIGLTLANNNLRGPMPSEIGDLASLKTLDLGKNNFGGRLPSFLFKLENLEYLWLYQCGFTGKIPENITKLNQLRVLNLGSNLFDGELPVFLSQLIKLEELRLHQCGFEGIIPSELGELPRLKIIHLEENYLTGQLPYFASTDLEEFIFHHNQLEGKLPSFEHLQRLKMLEGQHNNFSGTLPEELGFITGLSRVRLDHNNFSGCVPSSYQSTICSLPNRENLDNFYVNILDDTIHYFVGDGYNFSSNSELPWQGKMMNFCSDLSQVGAPCMVADIVGKINDKCQCQIPCDTPVQTYVLETLCKGESIQVNGQIYDVSNPSGQEKLISKFGCDSLVNISLSFREEVEIKDSIIHCGSYQWRDGLTYDESTTEGIFRQMNSSTCDTLYTLDLTIYPSYQFRIDTSLCPGDVFRWDGKMIEQDGVFEASYTTAMGCDSLVQLGVKFDNTNDCQNEQAEELFVTPNEGAIFQTENMETDLTIFGRWGNKVFHENRIPNNYEWRGTSQTGQLLPSGVYYYILSFSNEPSRKGVVTILKL